MSYELAGSHWGAGGRTDEGVPQDQVGFLLPIIWGLWSQRTQMLKESHDLTLVSGRASVGHHSDSMLSTMLPGVTGCHHHRNQPSIT